MRILIGDDSSNVPASLQTPLRQLFGDDSSSATRLAVSLLSRVKSPGDKRFPSLDLEDQPELCSAVLDALGLALLHQGYPDEAEKPILRALEIRRRFYGEDHPVTASSQLSHSQLLRAQGRTVEAERTTRRALAINARVYGGESLPVAMALSELAAVQMQQTDYTAAEQSALAGLSILEKLKLECRDPYATRLMDILAGVHQVRGDYQRAADLYLKILDLDRSQVGEKNIKFGMHVGNLASVEHSLGRFDDAERHYRQAIDIYRADTRNDRHPDLIDIMGNLGALLQEKGDLPGAREIIDEAIRLGTEVRGPDHLNVAIDRTSLGRVHHAAGDFGAAEQSFAAAIDIFRRNIKESKLPPDQAHLAEALSWKARSLLEGLRDARAAEAETLVRESIDILSEQFGERTLEQAVNSALLGRALFLQGKALDEARERLTRSYPIVVAVKGQDSVLARLIEQWIEELSTQGA